MATFTDDKLEVFNMEAGEAGISRNTTINEASLRNDLDHDIPDPGFEDKSDKNSNLLKPVFTFALRNETYTKIA